MCIECDINEFIYNTHDIIFYVKKKKKKNSSKVSAYKDTNNGTVSTTNRSIDRYKEEEMIIVLV